MYLQQIATDSWLQRPEYDWYRGVYAQIIANPMYRPLLDVSPEEVFKLFDDFLRRLMARPIPNRKDAQLFISRYSAKGDDEHSNERRIEMMRGVLAEFYANAVAIGNHPFIEFNGVMGEYVRCCEAAHARGIDFTECDTHTGIDLPMAPHQIEYTNEKLKCIYTGRSVVDVKQGATDPEQAATDAIVAIRNLKDRVESLGETLYAQRDAAGFQTFGFHLTQSHLLAARDALGCAVDAAAGLKDPEFEADYLADRDED